VIYFLLARGERSHWHRIDAVEIWHTTPAAYCTCRSPVMAGSAASGSVPISPPAKCCRRSCPAGAWQAAESTGDWTLAGCTVAPGFDFAKFELAPKGWAPGG